MKNHSSRPNLTLVGASVRAAAQSAARAGLSVVGFDLFGDSDCRSVCDQFELISPPIETAAAGATTAAGATALRLHAALRLHDVPSGAASSVLQVGGLSSEVCSDPAVDSLIARSTADMRLRDPDFLADLVAAAGIKFPLTLRAGKASTRFVRQRITSTGERWLWKDASGSGGIHVRWVSDRPDPNCASPDCPGSDCPGSDCPPSGIVDADQASDADSHIYQRWIAGKRFGASYLSDGNETIMLGVCRSLHTRKPPFPFVYGGSYGPVSLTAQQTETLCKLGDTLVTNTGLKGLFGIDVIVDAWQRLWLLEINPRWTASSELIERSLIRRNVIGPCQSLIGSTCRIQFPHLENEIDSPSLAEVRTRLLQNVEVTPRFLKKVVFARKSGNLDRQELARAEMDGIQCYDVPQHAAFISKGHPLCSLIAAAPSQGKAACPASREMRWRESIRIAQASVR
ncbi:ATP-grasp domain-containing protein [Novipirellula caenicola]|uniref:ATP-grasp domain-containing protein n=1 Tax=Novipirellula caenicola TaxID=1536901 RepID=A0ABP9VKH9_9BACT